ncbi:unnamed protein product [Calypogeia fissa]
MAGVCFFVLQRSLPQPTSVTNFIAIASRALRSLVPPKSYAASIQALAHGPQGRHVTRAHPTMAGALVTTGRCCGQRRPRSTPIPPPLPIIGVTPRELQGNALGVIRDAFPHHVGYTWPDGDGAFMGYRTYDIPVDVPIEVWGRRWIVQPSSLGPPVGLGLFFLDDIIVDDLASVHERPQLLPFYGQKYSERSWRILSRQCPSFGRYAIAVNADAHYSQMDGYPPRTGNLAGFINSFRGHVRRGFQPNAEWVEYIPGTSQHPRMTPQYTHYVLTHATRTIRVGDEILVDYEWRRD